MIAQDEAPLGKLITIAIDGPAASGKSTVASMLGRRQGILFLDTGVMYRGVTVFLLQQGLDPADEGGVVALAEEAHFAFPMREATGNVNPHLLLNGNDITLELRTPEVTRLVSRVAAYPGVRAAVDMGSRAIAATRSVVMVGRDIGTVVLPDATIKVYLDAPLDERARRRYDELRGQKDTVSYEEIRDDLRLRDRLDSERAIAPLRSADDAVILDTTRMTSEEVVRRIEDILRERLDDR